MKLLLPLRIGRDECDLVNLWNIVMGIGIVVFVHFRSALGTKRSGSCCSGVPAAGPQRRGGRTHGALQVAGEAVRLFSLFRMILPPPFIS